MKTLSRQGDSSREEQASIWAARLEGGTLSAADRDALDVWLNADATHRPLLSRYCQFSVDLDEPLLALVATGAVTLPPEPEANATAFAPARTVLWRHWNLKWVAGTALAAAAAVALVVGVTRPVPTATTIATAAAQRTSLTLSDGTRVELNAHTRLTAAMSANERRVQFSGGEAFFTVRKDASRPFIVETPAGSVRVTGTVFGVRSETASDLEVAVVEGSVQVRPSDSASDRPTDAFNLGALERLSAIRGSVERSKLSAAELDDALAWRQGQVVFRNVALNEALQQFARFHGRKIIPSSAVAVSGKSVGGRYSIDDLEGFLQGLEATHDVHVSHEGSGTIRVVLNGER